MNQHLQNILNTIQEDRNLSGEEKATIIKSLKDANKELEITSFKLDRTEKVKRTTAILLEETIEKLEQKRKAVDAQNRELEIESSLERVRTVAMSMKEAADMLDVCRVISAQLELLNIKEIRNVQTAIFYKENGTYMNYEYYAKHNKTFITETSYTNSEMHTAFAAQMMKGAGEFFSTNINGDEVKDWLAYQKTTNVFIDDFLYTASSLNYYWFSLGPVALGISTYEPLKENDTNLFKRFVKVFELAYRRYLDIEQAEAQAREAKIEAALEKVRSRSLAVYHSNEFKEVITVVFEKLQELGIVASSVSINTFIEGSKDAEAYICGQNEGELSVSHIRLVYFDHPISNDRYNAQKSGLDFFSKNYSYEEKNSFFKYLFEISDLQYLPDDIKKMVFQSKRYTISMALAKNSMIVVNDFEGKLLSEKEIDIVKRFSKVFEQAYTRFLDLQKAEAQTRESQIQLALERARTQSMIMKHSNELDDTLRVFHEQVLLLGIPSAFSFLWLPDEEKDRHIFWAAWAENNSTVFKSKAINYPLDRNEAATAQCLVDWKSNEPVVSYHVPPDGVENYFAAWSELIVGVEQLKPEYFSDGLYYVEAFMKYGCFGIMVKSELPEEEKKILGRFAVEFERAYIRFLDLQKAEAQAREAKIEAALEKVRSRSLAMYETKELQEIVTVVFEKLRELGVALDAGGAIINIFIEQSKDVIQWIASPDLSSSESYYIPHFEHPIFTDLWNARDAGLDFFSKAYSYEEKNSMFKQFFEYSDYKYFPDDFKKWILQNENYSISGAWSKHSAILIPSHSGTLPSEEQKEILKRFAKVFEQAYTRFLDLQKAEAQARESQIQLALERVRARTMAMQKSDELKYAATLLFQRAKALGVPAYSCGYNIWEKGEKEFTSWMSTQDGTDLNAVQNIPLTEDANFIRFVESKEKGEPFFVLELRGKRMQEHYKYLKTIPAFKAYFDYAESVGFDLPETQIHHIANFSQGNLLFITLEPCPEFHDVFKRFAAVFEQTYTRFLDLQKAEAQARESQIQLALERVRARTMAMQRSDELQDAAILLFQQMKALGVQTGSCGFNIWDKDEKAATVWMSSAEGGLQAPFKMPHTESAIYKNVYAAMKNGETFLVKEVGGKALEKHFDYLLSLPGIGDVIKHLRETGYAFPETMVYHFAFFKNGYLSFHLHQPYPEAHDIFKRFAKVFEQTYTRFLDLQKAEAQAREAQIEAALERVRSKTMGMQKSDELKEIIQVVYEQFVHLNINIGHTGFVMDYKARDDYDIWIADPLGVPSRVTVPYFDSMYYNRFNEAKVKGEDFLATNLSFEEKNKFYQKLFEYVPGLPEEAKEFYFSCPGLAASTVLLDNVCLYIENFSGIPYTDEENNTLMRFGKVFQQTYTRFLDLQKAEMQARQAKIEAAMEKVRSRAMAMQKPNELVEVAELLRKEMGLLGVEELETSSIYIHHEDTHKTECWYAIKDVNHPDKELVSDHMNINLNDTVVGKQMLAFYHSNKKQISIPMQGDARKEWINYCANHSKVLVGFYGETIPDRTYHLYKFSNGYMGAASPGDISSESWDLLQRATSVFSLAYTRFNDLQYAEAQTREAKIEAALERVRSRTLAMQKSDELAETAAVLFKQLILLGIEPNRLYINIVKDEKGDSEFWITDEDGSKVSLAFESNMNDNVSFKKMYKGWKEKKKLLMIDMKGKELKDYFQHLKSIHVPFKDGLIQKRRLQYIAYFNRGFIGMASSDEQPEETVFLLERFAAVFNLTFTRFNDLKIAEAHAIQADEDLIKLQTEKARAEDALTELKETQKQLIQSEKMASLGELTAGIAHEIQNPLNFVNNFSEVSKELLDEMKTALENGDEDDVKQIANDVIKNLEKINHHGKRADAIVKGMLQHSRSSSSATKESTDINALVDEYIRLCYHGLRAKDKSFNAVIKTDFDPSIGNINIIPQDVGRVLLNLLTNAFYAISERLKINRLAHEEEYKPLVSIQTKKISNNIEIRVSDNGNGMSQNIINKIFQPFFTTKPTGQGTGLGLSLSYDIIKAHGGDIKVETKEQIGSEFMITLPC